MYRTEVLVIKLDKTERVAIKRLAEAERLPTSTMARRLLLDEAEQRGLWPPVEARADQGREQAGGDSDRAAN